MASGTELATVPNGNSNGLALSQADFVAQMTREKFREAYMPGAKDEADVNLCFEVMRQTGLNPVLRQIYFLERSEGYGDNRKTKVTPQTSIDGYRLIAERSGKRDGELPPQWCGRDGVWHDIWPKEEPPFAARVGVCKRGCSSPFYGVAHYSEYCATRWDNKQKQHVVMGLWTKMPAQMLAKCAEALAIRKAFPQETAGIYTREEMQQADNHVAVSHTPGPVGQGESVEAEFVENLNPITESDIYKQMIRLAGALFQSQEEFTAWVTGQGKAQDTLTEDDCKELGKALKVIYNERKAAKASATAETPEQRAAVKQAWFDAMAGKLDEHTAFWWGTRDHGFQIGDDTLSVTPLANIAAAAKAMGTLNSQEVDWLKDDYRNRLDGETGGAEEGSVDGQEA